MTTEVPARARILLVDDRPANLLALGAILEPLGHELVRAESGEEALRVLLADPRFAVILLDAQMPGMDGFETASVIKSRRRTKAIPIIFITGLSRETDHVFRGYQSGAVDYLLKPFDPDILRSKVSVFVDLWLRGERIERQAEQLREQERVLAQQQSERRFRALVDVMPVHVWAVRPDGQVYFINRASLEYCGLAPGEVMHVVGPRCVHAADAPRANAAWQSALATGAPFEARYRLLRADGAERWHHLRAVPDRNEHGEVVGWIATAADVHEQTLADEQRAELLAKEHQARTAAEAASRAKDEFLAMVSHELRTPLTSILGWTGILRARTPDPQKLARGLETIERNARAQRDLIEDILDVSRIITGKLRLDPAELDLAALVESAVEGARPTADARRISLSVEVAESPLRFCGDAERLQQVVGNLLSNALKFTPSGGRVGVRLARAGEAVEIEVRDDGIGIAPDFLPHVFERFRQADSTSSRSHGGLGLGLAIVRHLSELHGGTIVAASEGAGRGASFTVRLPARGLADSALPAQPPLPARAGASLANLRILVVDDEKDARETLAEVLGGFGAEVTAVASVAEAMQSLEASKPDVLVSDIGLPEEDGYSLIRRVRSREEWASIPAAALTAYAGAEDGRKALTAGFHTHLPKPFDPARLATIIATLAGAVPEAPRETGT